MSRIIALILNWNGAEETRGCVEALLRSTNVDVDFLIIDNASPDGSGQILARWFGAEHVLLLPTNAGYAGGMNAGITRWLTETHDYAMLLTQDTRLEPDTVERLLGVLEIRHDAGVVGPRLHSRSSGDLFSAGGKFAVPGRPLQHSLVPLTNAVNGVAETDWIDGSCMLVRRETMMEIGGFDDRYYMYVEEVDLCWRAREAGWHVLIATCARAAQIPGQTTSLPIRRYYMARNLMFFERKRQGLATALRTAWPFVYWDILPVIGLGGRHTKHRGGLALSEAVGLIHGLVGRGGRIPDWLARTVERRTANQNPIP